MVVGLAAYALWRVVQAVLDTENKGSGPKGLVTRAGYLVIAVIHAGLATAAFALASGSDTGAQDSTPAWTARLMSQPLGQWLVAGAGVVVVLYAAVQLRRAYSLSFRSKLRLREMSAAEERWAMRLGRLGYGARGVVFSIIGAFLVVAAIRTDPQQARGLDGALDALAQQHWGGPLLGVVACGLAAYGLFMFVEARYRRMVIS
jgi:hypothetical protein